MPPLPFWTMMTLHVFLTKTTVDAPIYNRVTTAVQSTRPMMVSCVKDGMPIGSQNSMTLMSENIQVLVLSQIPVVILMVDIKLHGVLKPTKVTECVTFPIVVVVPHYGALQTGQNVDVMMYHNQTIEGH